MKDYMSIKQKILNAVSAHPKLATFAIGLAVTMAVGAAIGMADHSHMAYATNTNNGGNAAAFNR